MIFFTYIKSLGLGDFLYRYKFKIDLKGITSD